MGGTALRAGADPPSTLPEPMPRFDRPDRLATEARGAPMPRPQSPGPHPQFTAAALPLNATSRGRGITRADVMSAAEVALLLGVPKTTVEDWARRGVVPSRKRGRRRMFLRWEIEDWLVAEDA